MFFTSGIGLPPLWVSETKIKPKKEKKYTEEQQYNRFLIKYRKLSELSNKTDKQKNEWWKLRNILLKRWDSSVLN
jgi:hypothetical protein